MVRVATRIGSTACRPVQQRCTARTILFRSTSSRLPLRFVTVIAMGPSGGARSKPSGVPALGGG